MKKLLFVIICIFLSAFILQGQNRPYITIWKTNVKGYKNSKQITIPAYGDFSYTWQEVANPENKGSGFGTGKTTIIFPQSGTYKISMAPTGDNPFHRIDFGNDNDTSTLVRSLINYIFIKRRLGVNSLKILKIIQWGDIAWTSFDSAYYDCENLKITATDIPNLSDVRDMNHAFAITAIDTVPNMNKWNVANVTNMNFMFAWAENFNQPINDWNISKVKKMRGLFFTAFKFNQPLNNWDVSNVIRMGDMFRYDTIFNQPLNNWDVSNVNDMYAMFRNASNFNQPLNNWNVNKVQCMSYMFLNAKKFNQPLNNWNVSRVSYMDAMFQGASKFNQPLNSWNVNRVIYMWYMFKDAVNFNQPLGNWQLNRTIRMNEMLDNSDISCENYSKTLKGWAKHSYSVNAVTLGAKNLHYSPDVAKKRQYLIEKMGWQIVGDSEGNCKMK